MRIKKSADRNEYINADGIWVRNFNKKHVPYVDINRIINEADYKTLLANELQNRTLNIASIDEEEIYFNNIVIVSDGYDFKERHKVLSDLPENVAIIATNGALKKWELYNKRAINMYVVNNPYEECMNYLPRQSNYYPVCVSSTRTYNEFLNSYQGMKYLYEPTQQKGFGKNHPCKYHIEDYRSSICASISLAYRFNVKKLMLFCCDDSFVEPRPASIQLENGLWSYPQQIKSQNVIDVMLFWLKHFEEVEVGNHSSGIEYSNANYISKDEVLSFFEDSENQE